MKYILTKDDFISNKESKDIINYFINKINKQTDLNGCNYAHFENNDYINLSFLKDKINSFFKQYGEIHKELNFITGTWALTDFRFKNFKPGNYFKNWHSEQSLNQNRILCFMIYLSDHNCGTEFFDGNTINSKTGRALIFPASFTHTHRGQICPENKERYLLGGYGTFI
jgi:hypothetical protein